MAMGCARPLALLEHRQGRGDSEKLSQGPRPLGHLSGQQQDWEPSLSALSLLCLSARGSSGITSPSVPVSTLSAPLVLTSPRSLYKQHCDYIRPPEIILMISQ